MHLPPHAVAELISDLGELVIIICLGALTWVSTHLLDPYRPLASGGSDSPLGPGQETQTPLEVQVVALEIEIRTEPIGAEPQVESLGKRVFVAGPTPETASAIKIANNFVLGCAIAIGLVLR